MKRTLETTDIRNVLVTGGGGFIGANLTRLLLDAGYRVTVLDNFSSGGPEAIVGLPLQVVRGDILDAECALQVARDQDAIVHLAAQTGVPGSLENPRQDCITNVIGTLNMLEAARHAGVHRFVFASSNAPLGRQKPPVDEQKAALPISPYGASKLAGEGYCLAYFGSWGLGTVVLRFGNVYGPFSSHKGSVVAKFLREMLAGEQLEIYGDGGQTRDFIYVGDLCRAIHAAIGSDASGEIFQIASGQPTTITELAERIQGLSGARVEIRHSEPRAGDMRDNYSAVTKARAVLNWQPQVDLSEGLRLTFDWFRRNPRHK